MHKKFRSIYAEQIRRFIAMKRSVNIKYVDGETILFQIDCLAMERNEASLSVTKEFAARWSWQRPNESNVYRYKRIRILAQFSKFLSDNGIPSFVPRLPRYPTSNFVPYIYTAADMEAIFEASGTLFPQQLSMGSSIMCLPVLIRVLYATGLRIGEALSLRDEDVDTQRQYLKVRDSKNGKERVIPISPSLTEVCIQYREYRNRLPLQEEMVYFFTTLNGQKCGYCSVITWFRKCLQVASIQCSGGKQPRLHDLRHTFAVKSLAQMAAAGVDLYASLPTLSNYLGHQSINATNHYVRMAQSCYPELIKELNISCLNVFPKFNNYEAD